MMFRRKLLFNAFKVSDLLIMAFSFFLATWVSYSQIETISFAQFLDMRIKIQNFVLFIGFVLIWYMIFSLFKLHHSKRLSNRWEEIKDVIKAATSGTGIILLIAFLSKIRMVTPIFLGTFWVASSGITILSRLILRYVLGQIRIRGRNLRYMLIIGTNTRAVQFAREIETKPELGYQIIGFVDDDYPENGEFKKSDYTLVSNLNDFSSFLRNHVVDEVVISLPMKSLYDQASRIVSLCAEQGINVRFLSNIFNLKLGQSKVGEFEDDSMITVSTGAMKGLSTLIKRALDFSASLILLILLAPLFFVNAILIKVTSPGPVFFVQDRVGLNKRRFRLYKFRTMVADAEKRLAELEQLNEVSGPVFKIKNDPRITPVGRFLRKMSIDELPQLFNVLKGDMSLVGPRPLPMRDYEGFDEDWHRRRFSVRPGITCLWQVNGRSNTSFDDWMKLDMEYIDHWSLALDLKILLETIPAVLKGSGAT
jgi:exopolysaccharide biosynthesis polyprenyl glycosylphosphotransferase